MAYNIIRTQSGEVLETMDKPWPEVQGRVNALNREGKGVYAKKVSGGTPTQGKLAFALPQDTNVYFVDAWTSGNPGIGGFRVLSGDKQVLKECSLDTVHTNNFYELNAIYLGLQFASLDNVCNRKSVIYSDSRTALAWITSGRHNASRDIDDITKLISTINSLLRASPLVTLSKWDTETYGEIPADYGRK